MIVFPKPKTTRKTEKMVLKASITVQELKAGDGDDRESLTQSTSQRLISCSLIKNQVLYSTL